MDQACKNIGTAEAANLLTGVKPVASGVLPWSAVAVVLIGAIWFGLTSCGGYAWQKTMFYDVASAMAGAALILPSKLLNSLRRKAVFLGALVCGYYVVEAAAAPFYPSLPASLAEYIGLFRIALGRGPCG